MLLKNFYQSSGNKYQYLQNFSRIKNLRFDQIQILTSTLLKR